METPQSSPTRELSYKALLDLIPTLVYVVDSKLKIQYVNGYTTELLGFGRHEMLDRPVHQFLEEKELPTIKSNISVPLQEFHQVWKKANGDLLTTYGYHRNFQLDGADYLLSTAFPDQLLSKHQETRVDKSGPPGPSPIARNKLNQCRKRLLHYLVGERKYLDPNLTLTKTAHDLQLPSKYLSFIVNRDFKLNFNEFVNLHRYISYLKLKNSANHAGLSESVLSQKAGFASLSTFYRARRKFKMDRTDLNVHASWN